MTDAMPETFHQRAKTWRKKKMRYTRAQFAELSGYSMSAIADVERGFTRGDTAHLIRPEMLKRYRLICAAIEAGLTDWDFDDK